MIKKPAIILLILFSLSGNLIAKNKTNSKEIYAYSQKISELAKDRIWEGFDPLKYTSLKSAEGENFISFASGDFSWKLSDEYFSNHSLEENLVITFHEAFHAFQRDSSRKGGKWGAENAMLVFEYQESSARNYALFNIESQILYSALQSKRAREIKEKIEQFLAVRKLRQNELEPRFAEFEKNAESNEGLAEYAGTKAVILAMKNAKESGVPFENTDVDEFLLNKFQTLNSITKIGRNIRLKFYYTGSAQGLLLDRLMKNWKTKVQMEKVSVQDLLNSNTTKTLSQKEIEAILKQYDYKKILSEEEKQVAQRKADNLALLEKILNQKGRKYIIDYSKLSKPGQIQFFDPMNVTMINDKLRIHTRSVRFAGENSFTAEFSQAVVEDLKNRQYKTVVPENESIMADGKSINTTKPSEIHFNESLVINSANFKLEAVAGTINITDEEIIVNLSDKK